MELKYFLIVGAGVAAFLMEYFFGKLALAILLPSAVAGVVMTLVVLADPKALEFLGIIGVAMFFLLASFANAMGATVGCVVAFGLRLYQKRSRREWT